MPPQLPVFLFNGCTLDLGTRTLRRGDEPVRLTPKEFQTLLLLVRAAPHAVPREAFLDAIWPGVAVGDTSLARNISSLRRALGADTIDVVPKFGYRFTLAVTVTAAAEARTAIPLAPAGVVKEAPLPQPTLEFGTLDVVDKPVFGHHLPDFLYRWLEHPWRKVAAAVALLAILALATGWLLTRPIRARAMLAWTDSQTGMMWVKSDNGYDVTRDQAIEYCRSLRVAGYSDWELPSIDEVQTLYDPAVSIPGKWGPRRPVYWHVKGNIHLTGGETASNLEPQTGQEQSYDFSFGRRNYDAVSFRADHRALCVRHP
jgi:DNA-binding winged helix-turn-helix (wHTH) protein